jgi:hypothetical protein
LDEFEPFLGEPLPMLFVDRANSLGGLFAAFLGQLAKWRRLPLPNVPIWGVRSYAC